MNPTPLISVVIVTWNSDRIIEETLASILHQSYPCIEVLVVDSASNDDTVQLIHDKFPEILLTPLKENLGYRGANRVGMKQAKGDFIVICNDDVVVEPDWLEKMVHAFEGKPDLAMVTPRILTYGQPDVVNVAGNELHFSGLYGPRGKGEPSDHHSESRDLAAVSGCCFMIRRDIMNAAGGFSEDFDHPPIPWHASFEDVDLCWHVQMLGYRIGYVADSVVYHRYIQPSRDNSGRFLSIHYGWWLFVLRNFDWSAIFLLMPVLSLVEMTWILYATIRGTQWIGGLLQSLGWFIANRRDWLAMRRSVQKLKRRTYWQLLPRTNPVIDFSTPVGGIAGRLGNAVLNLVFRVYYQFLLIFRRRIE